MSLTGKAWKYGDDVDTDAIIPARYLALTEPEELAAYCMMDIDAEFAGAVQPGDIIVAGKNFGCGSSREHAPLALKGAGISCVIAETFARIFYRNSINIGLPILECPQAARETQAGDTLEVDLESGTIKNTRTGKLYHATPYPPFMLGIIEAGGLVPYTKKQLAA
jgi:3-isopropylmalate/(R)-2-methylmalate dehydratase small subunit